MSPATTPEIRPTRPGDLDALLALYRAVAARPGGLAREADEISREYVADILGFRREGRLDARVRSVNGGLEADIPMAWMRPAASR